VLECTDIKLLDFGMAVNPEEHCSGGGSVPFFSPEKILRQKSSYSDDMWAVGLTLLELATGRLPFKVPLSNDHKHLRLIELFCGEQLPNELISKVSPERRDRLFKSGKLSKARYEPRLQAEQLEVLFCTEYS
jgi:serine/threonine protein kinase